MTLFFFDLMLSIGGRGRQNVTTELITKQILSVKFFWNLLKHQTHENPINKEISVKDYPNHLPPY